MVPEIPAYWTGSYRFGAVWPKAEFSGEILPVVMDFAANKSIVGAVRGCNGRCTATIRAPALIATHCNSTIVQKNYSAPYTAEEMRTLQDGNIPATRVLFDSVLTIIKGDVETLELRTYQSGDEVAETCAGPVKSTHCYLRSAIADYKVVVTNDSVALQDPGNPEWVAWANNTALTEERISKHQLRESEDSSWVKTTLSGVVGAFIAQYELAEGTKPPDAPGAAPGHLRITGRQSSSWFLLQHITNYEKYNNGSACSYAWKDPRPAAMVSVAL